MRLCLLPLLLLFCASGLRTQTLSSISSRWSDSFVEWDLFAVWPDTLAAPDSLRVADEENDEPEEQLFGDLKLRWLNVRDDWSEWDYNLNDQRGTIKLKWKNDPTQWELRTYDGSVVTMRAAWPNDMTEWRITDNTHTLTFKSRWTNTYDEWLAKDPNLGTFYLYTLRTRDPRDWAIEDRMAETISLPMKMAMTFIAVFHTSPRQ